MPKVRHVRTGSVAAGSKGAAREFSRKNVVCRSCERGYFDATAAPRDAEMLPRAHDRLPAGLHRDGDARCRRGLPRGAFCARKRETRAVGRWTRKSFHRVPQGGWEAGSRRRGERTEAEAEFPPEASKTKRPFLRFAGRSSRDGWEAAFPVPEPGPPRLFRRRKNHGRRERRADRVNDRGKDAVRRRPLKTVDEEVRFFDAGDAGKATRFWAGPPVLA